MVRVFCSLRIMLVFMMGISDECGIYCSRDEKVKQCQDGQVYITTHRILWINAINSLEIMLSYVVNVKLIVTRQSLDLPLAEIHSFFYKNRNKCMRNRRGDRHLVLRDL